MLFWISLVCASTSRSVTRLIASRCCKNSVPLDQGASLLNNEKSTMTKVDQRLHLLLNMLRVTHAEGHARGQRQSPCSSARTYHPGLAMLIMCVAIIDLLLPDESYETHIMHYVPEVLPACLVLASPFMLSYAKKCHVPFNRRP